MNTYIWLNSMLFEFSNRKPFKYSIGSKLIRALDGTGSKDLLATKKKWIITFEHIDLRTLNRIENIYDLNSSISFVDWDSNTYTVIVEGDFDPNYEGDNLYSIQIILEQV